MFKVIDTLLDQRFETSHFDIFFSSLWIFQE